MLQVVFNVIIALAVLCNSITLVILLRKKSRDNA